MDKKEKIVKTAKYSYVASMVLYILACVLCLAFIVLAIVIPVTSKKDNAETMELCTIFIDGALSSFFAIGVLWNVTQWFKSIRDEGSPFTARLPRYMLKTGIITILASIIPSVISTAIIQATVPDSDMVFNIGIGGIICGIILIVASVFFNYAADLQKRDDETL